MGATAHTVTVNSLNETINQSIKPLRQLLPDLKVRFINVVDLFKLILNSYHPHGLTDRE
jgi:phosphoketolase